MRYDKIQSCTLLPQSFGTFHRFVCAVFLPWFTYHLLFLFVFKLLRSLYCRTIKTSDGLKNTNQCPLSIKKTHTHKCGSHNIHKINPLGKKLQKVLFFYFIFPFVQTFYFSIHSVDHHHNTVAVTFFFISIQH